MSGQQWGSVIGGVIGSFIPVVGTALGSTIGGIIGGWVDPTKIYGPRLSDAQTQTAMDGVPRAYGDGTFPCRGNLIWQDIVKEHKHKDDGKGSGQKQITYTYTRSYAIGVCKGPISGFKAIKRNKKIVFDARTDAELSALGYTSEQIAESRAAQAKFLQKCTLYYGTADQQPDPTIVAVKGVGHVPAYTGTAYIVLTDDETMQGEVAQYEFVVANCGDRTEDGADPNATGWLGTGIMASGLRASVRELSYAGDWLGSGEIATTSVNDSNIKSLERYGDYLFLDIDGVPNLRIANVSDVETWMDGPVVPSTDFKSRVAVSGGRLFHYGYSPTVSYLDSPSDTTWGTRTFSGGFTSNRIGAMAGNGTQVIAVNDYGQLWGSNNNGDSFSIGALLFYPTRFYTTNDAIDCNGSRFVIGGADDGNLAGAFYTDDAGATVTRCLFPNGYPTAASVFQVKYCGGDTWLLAMISVASLDDFALYMSQDNGVTFSPVTSLAGLIFNGRNKQAIAVDANANRVVVVGVVYGTGVYNAFYTDNFGTWTPISLSGTTVTGIAEVYPIGSSHVNEGVAIPDAPGFYIDPATGQITGPSGTQVSVCKPTLGQLVSRQCAKRINTSVINVSELTDEVVGFRVASPSSPKKNIQALQPGYFFDGSEFDGVLHFPKRGGEDSFALTIDDLCERDGDLIQWETKQEPELLRKVTVGYMDPDTTYTATTQQWERRAATVKAEGEGVVEFPVVESKDWAAQAAHKTVKVGWAEADECTFDVSIGRSDLVTAAVGTIADEKGTVHRIRIERIEDEGLRRMIHARRTRSDVYESTVSGAAKPLPLFPGSNIRGPADALLMNLPLLGDTNDVPGLYWAAAGFLSGYVGTSLQLMRAGEWTDVGSITTPCAMGTLLSDLPLFEGDVDYGNTLHVRMNDDLESVTFHNLLSERNPIAILKPDGTAEIVQFQTATEVAPGEYACTTLIRGRLDTTRAAHVAGARVVFLDSRARYGTLRPEDLGKTLTFRAVSIGTDPDAAPTFECTLTTMESQREWQPYNATYEAAGDDWSVAFIGRYRLGTDVFPLASANFRGWRIDFTVGSVTKSRTTLTQAFTYTEAMQIADFGSAQSAFDSVTVTATNLYTNGDGAGNPGAGTIATLLEP